MKLLKLIFYPITDICKNTKKIQCKNRYHISWNKSNKTNAMQNFKGIYINVSQVNLSSATLA